MKIYSMDIGSIMDESFRQVFKRYNFEKIGLQLYRNKYCTFKVEVIDPFTIRMQFAKNSNPQEFYSLYPYLCFKLQENYYDIKPSLYSPEYYEYKNEELAVKAFFKHLSTIAKNQLVEPFTGDFSWENQYNDLRYFLQNTKKIISQDEAYSELRPEIGNYKQGALIKMHKAALKIYFEQKDIKTKN